MGDRTLKELRAALAARPEIALAYLFGSRARGSGAPGSDLDVAVLIDPVPPNGLTYRARLAEDLAKVTGVHRVDVVLLSEAPPPLGGRIVRDGRLLVCRDETTRVRQEVFLLQREFDTARLRRELDRAQSAAIRDGAARG